MRQRAGFLNNIEREEKLITFMVLALHYRDILQMITKLLNQCHLKWLLDLINNQEIVTKCDFPSQQECPDRGVCPR